MGDVTEENATGMLEFTVQGGTEDDFFPASVEFESTETFLKTAVGNKERLVAFDVFSIVFICRWWKQAKWPMEPLLPSQKPNRCVCRIIPSLSVYSICDSIICFLFNSALIYQV